MIYLDNINIFKKWTRLYHIEIQFSKYIFVQQFWWKKMLLNSFCFERFCDFFFIHDILFNFWYFFSQLSVPCIFLFQRASLLMDVVIPFLFLKWCWSLLLYSWTKLFLFLLILLINFSFRRNDKKKRTKHRQS